MSCPPFRFVIELPFDKENAYSRINSALYLDFDINEPLKSNVDEYVADNFTISLDEEIAILRIHKSYCSKLDWHKIFSIVTPIANALDIEVGDYEVYDYKKDKYIDLPDNIYEYADYTNPSEKKALAKGPTNNSTSATLDNSNNTTSANSSAMPDNYRYKIDIPICDCKAYQRIANAIDVPDAFPRKRRDDYDDYRVNNYGEYKTDRYSIFLDGDIAFISFVDLDLDFMASIMSPICDALLIKRGNYTIIDDDTGCEIDPSSVTLKSVLDLEDGERTPLAKQRQHIRYDDDGNSIHSDCDSNDNDSDCNSNDQDCDQDQDTDYETDCDCDTEFSHDDDTFGEHLRRIRAEYPHYTEDEMYERARQECDNGYNYMEQAQYDDDIDVLLENDKISIEQYITKKVPISHSYENYTVYQRNFLQMITRYTKAYNQENFSKPIQYKYMLSLYTYIKYNIKVFTYEFNKANLPTINKFFNVTITKAQELLQTATNELAKVETTVDPVLINSLISVLNDTIPIVQSVIDYINK